jgi:hypothetical protein
MAQDEMKTKEQQLKLSWQLEWIWHVHRLHPILLILMIATNNFQMDLSINKFQNFLKMITNKKKTKFYFHPLKVIYHLNPSVDLTSALIRQKDFLDKFQKHFLYSCKLSQVDRFYFQDLIQNNVSFIKLTKRKQLIVPTFEIDLIWHTHIRFPSHYHEVSKTLCGFIVDHDDAIESNILTDAYKKTADRWKETYQSEYGQNIHRKYLETTQYLSSCALVFVPIITGSSYLEGME